MDEDLTAQQIGRLVFVGGLLLIFLVMLVWAFNPSEEGGISFSMEGTSAEQAPAPDAGVPDPVEEAPPADDAAEGEDDPVAEPDPDATAEPDAEEPTPEPTETGPAAEELIAAAPEPGETSVQVLDAGGGNAATRAAADAIEDLGYRVVNVTSARANLTRTAIWFNDGQEEAARALRAREERIADLEENQALSTSVDLHVLVGADWSEG